MQLTQEEKEADRGGSTRASEAVKLYLDLSFYNPFITKEPVRLAPACCVYINQGIPLLRSRRKLTEDQPQPGNKPDHPAERRILGRNADNPSRDDVLYQRLSDPAIRIDELG